MGNTEKKNKKKKATRGCMRRTANHNPEAVQAQGLKITDLVGFGLERPSCIVSSQKQGERKPQAESGV